jgi:hypothetical protein
MVGIVFLVAGSENSRSTGCSEIGLVLLQRRGPVDESSFAAALVNRMLSKL